MATHIIMDHSGHSTVAFDPKNDAQVTEAMARFEKLVGEDKHIAVTRNAGESDYTLARSFKDTKDETLFRPQMQGG
jgi:hypothetical protein